MFKRVCILCALAIAALSFTGMAVAADSGSDQNNTQQLMKTYRSDAQQLKEIHDKAIQSNPQLAKQQQEFQDQVKSAMKDQGYDIKASQKRIQAIAKKLQSDDQSDEQRKQTMQQFQTEREKLIKARNAALAQPDVEKSGQKLEKNTLSAMNKQSPKTEQLLSEMKGVRSQLQQSAGANDGGSGN